MTRPPKVTKWDIMGLISAGLTFIGFIFETVSSIHIRDDVDSRVEQILDERGYEPINTKKEKK